MDLFGSLIELLKVIWSWFIPWTVLEEYQNGVLLRLGRPRRRRPVGRRGLRYATRHPWLWRAAWAEKVEDCVVEPGFVPHWPFGIDKLLDCNVVPTTDQFRSQEFETLDGQAVSIHAIVRWRVRSPRKFMLEVEDAKGTVTDCAMGTIREMCRERTWDQINDLDFPSVVTKEVRRKAFEDGIEVIRVQFPTLCRLGMRHGVLRLNTGGW